MSTLVTRRDGEGRTVRHTWASLLQSETGVSVSIPGAADRSIQITGTFGGASVGVQGSLEAVAANWSTLTDAQGNALTFTSAGLEAVSEVVTHIRPAVTGGDGTTDLAVTLLSRSTMR